MRSIRGARLGAEIQGALVATRKKKAAKMAVKRSAKKAPARKAAAPSRPKTAARPRAAARAKSDVPSIPHRAASRVIVGFDGTTLTHELGDLIDMGIAGVILFRRNVE